MSSYRKKTSEGQAGCGSGQAVHTANTAGQNEQVGQQLGKDRWHTEEGSGHEACQRRVEAEF